MKKHLYILFAVLINLQIFSQIPSYVPVNGLVGYWPFTGNANDQSVNSNNGAVTGAILTQDRFGNNNSAYSFNGTSDFITVPNSSNLSGFNDMSISIWVNMSQYSGYQALVYKWAFVLNCGSNSDNYAASMSNNSIMLAANYNNTTGYMAPQVFTSADLNTWKQFVFVSNSAVGTSIYINGVLNGTGGSAGNLCSSLNALLFGVAPGGQRFFKGKLDDIGIWNRVLTNCEISQLYNASSVNPTSSNSQVCAGSSVTLTAGSGATNYLWNTAATTSAIVVSPTVTTTYTVTETNTLTSCSYTGVVTQSVSILNMSASTSNSIICRGNSATLTVNSAATSYFWNTSATGSVIVVSPIATTSYTVFGTSAVTGCTNTAVVTQSVSLCTGIENVDLNNSISLYPNPSNGNFIIKSDLLFSNYEITNMLGQLIASGSIENNTVDAGNLAQGIYNIILVSDKIKTRKKIVIE